MKTEVVRKSELFKHHGATQLLRVLFCLVFASRPVTKVREWYVISYEEIRDFPRPVTVDEEVRFAELLKVRPTPDS